jgi:hypothetical protein
LSGFFNWGKEQKKNGPGFENPNTGKAWRQLEYMEPTHFRTVSATGRKHHAIVRVNQQIVNICQEQQGSIKKPGYWPGFRQQLNHSNLRLRLLNS